MLACVPPAASCVNQPGMIGDQEVDGCFCFHAGQQLPQCAEMFDENFQPVCVDFDCAQSNPGFQCDAATCDCQPVPAEPVPTLPDRGVLVMLLALVLSAALLLGARKVALRS